MIAFDGTQPTFRQSPPSQWRSISATFAPSAAAPCAATNPAVPAPTTTRLYRSAGCGLRHPDGCTFSSRSRSYTSSGIVQSESLLCCIAMVPWTKDGLLQPAAAESGAPQTGAHMGAVPHKPPDQFGAMVLDHHRHDALTEPEVPRGNPGAPVGAGQRGIEA